MSKIKSTLMERFWARVNRDLDTGCWLWTGPLNHAGYAAFRVPGKTTTTGHRHAYEVMVEPIPAGLELDHLCRVRACVNPAHLEPVTHAENMRRAAAVRTSCTNGHAYSDRDVTPEGARQCQTCRADRNREFVQRRRRLGLQPGDPRHGSRNGYFNCGCRCDQCKVAAKEFAQEQRDRKKAQ